MAHQNTEFGLRTEMQNNLHKKKKRKRKGKRKTKSQSQLEVTCVLICIKVLACQQANPATEKHYNFKNRIRSTQTEQKKSAALTIFILPPPSPKKLKNPQACYYQKKICIFFSRTQPLRTETIRYKSHLLSNTASLFFSLFEEN